MVQKAKDDPSFKATVMVKDFNLPQNTESGWLRWDELNNEETVVDYPFRYFIGGFDAADYIDLNAAKAICKKPDDDRLYVNLCTGYRKPSLTLTLKRVTDVDEIVCRMNCGNHKAC